MHPKKLDEHTNKLYTFENSVANNSKVRLDHPLVFSYYHFDDFPINMHSHNFYEINIITEGHGRHYLEENNFSAFTGDVFVIPPNAKHGYWSEENLKIFHILLSNNFIEKYGSILKEIPGFTLLFDIEPNLRVQSNKKIFPSINKSDFSYIFSELHKLNVLCDYQYDGIETVKSIKVMNLIYDFASMMPTKKFRSDTNIFIDTEAILKTITYISQNFSNDISILDLCQLANMSRSTFLKQFFALCNYTPNDLIATLRLEKSCALLSETSLSIAQIAQDCGYFDSAHFSKVFSKKYGMLPKEYRKSSYARNE